MKKLILSILFILCLSFQASAWNPMVVVSGGAGAGAGSPCTGSLHCDDWESNNLTTGSLPDAWDASSVDSGDMAVAANPGYMSGSYSVKCVVDDTSSLYVMEDLGSDQGTIWMEFEFSMSDVDGYTAYTYWRPLLFDTTGGGGQWCDVEIVDGDGDGDINTIRVKYNSGAANVAASVTDLVVDTKYTVTVKIKDESVGGDGEIKVWLDDAKIIDNSTIDFEAAFAGVGRIYFGVYYVNLAAYPLDIYLDNFGSSATNVFGVSE